MKMKMICRNAARLGAVALCSAALMTAPMMAQGGGGRGPMTPEQQKAQMDAMATQLSLTPDQVTKITAINADTMKQSTDLRASGEDMATLRPKMMALRTAAQTKIKALLTDDQKAKYTAYLAAQPQGRGPGGGAPPATPPNN